MKYMGSKNRHAKELLPIILKDRQPNQYYIEPFVGGFNMIDKVENPRMASDIHPHLISLFVALQSGWEPPDVVSEVEYQDIRKNKHAYPAYLVGFVGFGCSYSGKWFGGYARGNDNKGNPRNYCLESKKNLMKQVPRLAGMQITQCSYWNIILPANECIIYCDPPYQGTTEYKDGNISYEEYEMFWNWVRTMTNKGHKVYVSEYNAPDDFEVLWSKKVNNTLTKDTGSKQGEEKLFKMKEGK